MPQARLWHREWQACWLAIGFLTRIPMMIHIDYSQRLMNQSSMYFPLVGLLLGCLYVVAFTLFNVIASPLVAVILVTILHLFITGSFHEDGLADSVDALGGGYTVEKRLAIMKDSRIGTYGAVALVMALLLKVMLLAEADDIWLALLVAPAASRLTPLLIMARLPYVSDPDKSKSRPVADGFSHRRLMAATTFVLLPTAALSFSHPFLILSVAASVLFVTLAWGSYLRSQLQGYTGDTLGAAVVFSELLLLLFL
jgi:adenosylcobinamide-GDP ribazoletransferase